MAPRRNISSREISLLAPLREIVFSINSVPSAAIIKIQKVLLLGVALT